MLWLIIPAAIALTALMFACIWVASDADDYSENRRRTKKIPTLFERQFDNHKSDLWIENED